ncbi:hypothetical protein DL96DRAFT_1510315 [Flagelloscypha sp. PMI_526]|nr:hypothetical protein DL96DRAFT_1510315 [Flagelloscypha sp. PMI_526]
MFSSLLLASIHLCAFGIPTSSVLSLRQIPREAALLAFDPDTNALKAWDADQLHLGSFSINATEHPLMQKRVVGSCHKMERDDIYKLPGIGKLDAEADKLWGNHKRNVYVNEKDYPNQVANICSNESGANFTPTKNPDCHTIENSAEGTLENGKITLTNQFGFSGEMITTVTKESSFMSGQSIGGTFKFGAMLGKILGAEVSAGLTFQEGVSNSQGSSQSFKVDQTMTQSIEQPVSADEKNCKITLSTQACQVQGTAGLQLIASGWVWYIYSQKTSISTLPIAEKLKPEHMHYMWALKMENVMSEDERRHTMDLEVRGNVQAKGKFTASGCSKPAAVTTAK